MKIRDLQKVDNSFIPVLVKSKNEDGGCGVVYFNPKTIKVVQLLSGDFARQFSGLTSEFLIGFTTGAIVGNARESTPEDQWNSGTIERSPWDKNSLYQGIIRIVEEEGIPVFLPDTRSIGNRSPVFAYLSHGNPIKIDLALEKYNTVQKHIISRILEGKPSPQPAEQPVVSPAAPQNQLIASKCGDGFKSANRLRSIGAKLDALTLSS